MTSLRVVKNTRGKLWITTGVYNRELGVARKMYMLLRKQRKLLETKDSRISLDLKSEETGHWNDHFVVVHARGVQIGCTYISWTVADRLARSRGWIRK